MCADILRDAMETIALLAQRPSEKGYYSKLERKLMKSSVESLLQEVQTARKQSSPPSTPFKTYSPSIAPSSPSTMVKNMTAHEDLLSVEAQRIGWLINLVAKDRHLFFHEFEDTYEKGGLTLRWPRLGKLVVVSREGAIFLESKDGGKIFLSPGGKDDEVKAAVRQFFADAPSFDLDGDLIKLPPSWTGGTVERQVLIDFAAELLEFSSGKQDQDSIIRRLEVLDEHTTQLTASIIVDRNNEFSTDDFKSLRRLLFSQGYMCLRRVCSVLAALKINHLQKPLQLVYSDDGFLIRWSPKAVLHVLHEPEESYSEENKEKKTMEKEKEKPAVEKIETEVAPMRGLYYVVQTFAPRPVARFHADLDAVIRDLTVTIS